MNKTLAEEHSRRDVVVGLDIGHASVKITFDTHFGVARYVLPSFVFPAMPIRNKFEAQLAAAETVQVDGRAFFVGNTAFLYSRGGLCTGLNSEWIRTIQHRALLAMALKVIDDQAPDGERTFVLGLPVSQYELKRQFLIEAATEILGQNAQIIVVPKPFGGYQAHIADRCGAIKSAHALEQESWAVVDVGYYSTDIILVQKGNWIETASGSCEGVSMAVDYLQRLLNSVHGIQANFFDAEKSLRCGFIKDFGRSVKLEEEIKSACAIVASKVTDMTVRLTEPFALSLDGIFVTGGGAAMVLPALQERCAHAQLIEDTHPVAGLSGSLFVISEGYYRFGRSVNLMYSAKRKAA